MSSNGDGHTHLVHETRKTIKRMRALARLLRRELGDEEFRRVDGALRDCGRRLSGARDAAVRLATLRALRERYPGDLAGEPVAALEARLQSMQAEDDESHVDAIVPREIDRMRGELLRLNLLRHEHHVLAAGLRRIYREGRNRYRLARRSGGRDPVRMHDWRKRAKSLYYALDMLGGKDAAATAKLTGRANRLGDLLGCDHDLWLLASWVEGDAELDEELRALLLELIERRRARVGERALRLGAFVYERKPKRFASRVDAALRAP